MLIEDLGNLGEFIGSLGVIFSLIYLGKQIQQQNVITRAQFGHSLTQRLYERYFQTSRDREYAEFMALDWSSNSLSSTDSWRIQMAILTYLVDIFDVYDKVKAGLVDEGHLNTRMRTLKFGVMKTTNARMVWGSWKLNRDSEFVEWFEEEIYGGESIMEVSENEEEQRLRDQLNTRR
ncbi:MAG: hypothetical protein CMP89_12865 [Gammaproteobacteria bacterium]|jgi:hypothetical protein|nr:hypothetical protein [Gammaproteobacteria bacterium]HCC45392.1 hypothetical protein [Gammaproteobacteria bacterium]|tara:strand:+ start:316 stop:846 length:531 start_codon:yes stop_codon:yes gene_type:complete